MHRLPRYRLFGKRMTGQCASSWQRPENRQVPFRSRLLGQPSGARPIDERIMNRPNGYGWSCAARLEMGRPTRRSQRKPNFERSSTRFPHLCGAPCLTDRTTSTTNFAISARRIQTPVGKSLQVQEASYIGFTDRATAQPLFKKAIRPSQAIMLTKVFRPGTHDKCFEITV
jgi:hypothetical protein